MESHKHPSLTSGRNQDGRRRRRSRWNAVSPLFVLPLAALAGIWWLFGSRSPVQGIIIPNPTVNLIPESQFSWSQITPSQSLQYHGCFDGFQCARLDVPMDYHRSDGQGTRMAIAITRLPARVPVTDPRYGGAILINPGGPGGSGVTQALLSGRNLQGIVDAAAPPSASGATDSSSRYFDIIGFDPRGVNNTTPGFSCFPNLFSQKNWELQAEADGMLGSSADSLMRNWQRAIALNLGCSQAISMPGGPGGDVLGEHTNTPPVARDMLEIVEGHGEWREKQGLEAQRRHDHSHGYDSQQTLIARTKWNRGREKLLYWGRSYGTILGSTFAALFPDRVERMVLDGVVDADKYYSDVGPDPIVDADAIFDKFALYCDQLGEDCPFYTVGGSDAIKDSYKQLEGALLNSSMAVLPSETRGPEVVTWTDLKLILRLAMYQPLAGFLFLAEIASDLVKGDGSKLADFKHGRRSPICLSGECLTVGPWSSECRVPGQNEIYSSAAILCSDAEYMQEVDEQGFTRHWRSLQDLSSTVGDYWAHVRLDCVGWSVKPKWQMPVPITGNTSYPLFFVNNILDPVTPLQRYTGSFVLLGVIADLNSAKKMSKAFPGSVLLQQDSEGHCTLAAPSACVRSSIRKYFQIGELPAPGTVCDADLKPLLGGPSKAQEEGSVVDDVLYRALLEEAQRIRVPGFPL